NGGLCLRRILLKTQAREALELDNNTQIFILLPYFLKKSLPPLREQELDYFILSTLTRFFLHLLTAQLPTCSIDVRSIFPTYTTIDAMFFQFFKKRLD